MPPALRGHARRRQKVTTPGWVAPAVLSEYGDRMTDLVLVRPLTSVDAYGTRQYGQSTGYAARVQLAAGRYDGPQGTVLFDGTVFVLGDPPIGQGDRLVLPEGRTVNVLKVLGVHDEHGPHHVQVRFGL